MDFNWNRVDSFPATGAGTGFFRDLAFANGKIWGSPLSNTIYGINQSTGVMEKTITTSYASIRACTWDPVRKGFWIGTNSFTGPLVCVDTNGVLIPGCTITMPASGCYGVGYDDDPAGPFLWVSTDQTPTSTTGTAFLKYNATTLTQVGTPLNVTVPLTSGAPLSSGGCEVVTNCVPGKRTIVSMVQGTPDRVIVTEIGNAGPTIPTGTWTEQVSGLTTVLYSVSAVNDDVAWVCGASGKVLRTINKGLLWSNVSGNLPTTYALYNIFAYDANVAIVTGVSGSTTAIYQTSNGGVNWTTANSHAGFGDDLWMSNASTGFFIGDPIAGNWDLLKSTNAGLNWSTWATVPTTNTSGTYNNAACFDGNNVWFQSVGLSTIHYSTNLGVNWTTQSESLAEITAISFNSSATGLAGGSSTSPGLLKSTNSGANWTALTSPYPTNSISGIVGAQSTWWVSQQGTGISISTNDGANWSTAYTAPAGSFYHMTKSRAGATIWAVRSNGGISRYGLITGISNTSTEVPATFSLSQNYPNPFNPTTKINFALPKSGLVTLKVYDVLGKEVATLVNEVKNAGTYNFEFDASNLTSGVYFYKIEANGFTDVKKMMLVK
ncbi:MAG: T9SS type A sorting domain-containing protein [Ignavibacteriae bacterium]|nr:T9SS type A sorting domain-containing protein [Ignavibacteriota bacterium]